MKTLLLLIMIMLLIIPRSHANDAVMVHPPATTGAPQDIFQSINWPSGIRVEGAVYHFGNAANNVPVLDSAGLLLLATVPGLPISRITGLQSALDAKEPAITLGTSSQYYRGDKTMQTLNFAAVGGTAAAAQVPSTLNSTTMPLLTLSGASNGVLFSERNGVGTDWSIYATGGILRLYNGSDRFTLDASGNIAANNFSGSSAGTNTGDQTTVSGNAGTATVLQTARLINGVSFSGSADITVTAAAGTLSGATLAAGVTASSLTSVGTITSGTWHGTAIGDTWISSAATWNAKEPAITGGTSSQYYRGDKTMQTLNQAAVAGLTTADSPAFAGLSVSGNGNVLGVVNVNDVTTTSRSRFQLASNAALLQLINNASAYTSVQFGVTLGGWAELIARDNPGGTNNGLIIGTFGPVPLVLGANNTEGLRIDSSGNVGIGTTTPSARLNVAGGVTASGNIAANNFSGSSAGTNTGDQTTVSGNAGTATVLQTARLINGVSFSGGADITVTAAAGTLSGATLAAGVTASSLTSVGTITGGTWHGTAIADTWISSAGAWNAKEPAITAGTSSQYYRGDKTMQTLNFAAVSGTAIATQIPSTLNSTTMPQLGFGIGASERIRLFDSGSSSTSEGLAIRINEIQFYSAGDKFSWRYTGGLDGSEAMSISGSTGNVNVNNNLTVGGAFGASDYTIGLNGSYAPNIIFEGDSITQLVANLTAAKTVTTTNGSATVITAGTFTDANVGSLITGTGIPSNTYIGVLNSSTSIGLSSSALTNVPVGATASGSITASITPYGYNNYMGAAAGSGAENFTVPAIGTYNGIAVAPNVGQNVGVAGYTTENLYESPARISSRYRQENGMNLVVYLAGTNNLGLNGETPAQTYSKIEAHCRSLQRKGIRVLVVCLISRGNGAGGAPGGANAGQTWDQLVGTVNGYIRQNWAQFSDHPPVDWAAINGGSNEFAAGGYSNTTWMQSDQLHPTFAGHRKMASYIQPAINDMLTYYFRSYRNQLFVSTNHGTHNNIYAEGDVTLTSETPTLATPTGGQLSINFAFPALTTNVSTLKANIRAGFQGDLNFGSTGAIADYIGSTGPDVFGTNGSDGPPLIFYRTTSLVQSSRPFQILSSSTSGPTTGKGLEMFYNSSNDYAYFQSYDHGGSAWEGMYFGGSQFNFAPGGTISASFKSGGGLNLGGGTLSPGNGNLALGTQSSKAGALYLGNDGTRYMSYVGGTPDYYNFAAGSNLIADGFTVRSSRALKQDIQDFKPANPNGFSRLRPRRFHYTSAPSQDRAGFIAEEVEMVMPEAVMPAPADPKDPATPRLAIDPMVITASLVQEVQALRQELNELKGTSAPFVPWRDLTSAPADNPLATPLQTPSH